MITNIIQILAVVATFTIAFLTFRYVKATKAIVDEMKTARETQLRPYIIIDFDFYKTSLCDMIIKNVGNGAAFDVQINFEPDVLYREPDIKLSDLPVFKQLNFFPAGKEIRFFFRNMRDKSKESVQNQFTANLEYKDSTGKPYNDTLSLDLTWHKKLMYVEVKDINDLVNTVGDVVQSNNNIQRQLQRLADLIENKEQKT